MLFGVESSEIGTCQLRIVECRGGVVYKYKYKYNE